MCFELKANYSDLRRSFKFNDDIMDIFVDVRTEEGAKWRRITPDKAREANILTTDPAASSSPDELTPADLSAMLSRRLSPEYSTQSS